VWRVHGPAEPNFSLSIWIRDSDGRWHAAHVSEYNVGDIAMQLEVAPPLSGATA